MIMKKISVEEKAKRYDEAIERANELNYVSDKDSLQRKTVEHIFPKLKESEDERIREEIISNLKEMIEGITSEEIIPHSLKVLVGKMRKWIAWLEKQSENISLPKFTFDDVLALQCVMETTKKVQEDKELYEQLQSLHDRLHDAYWLEKQGEQKSSEDEDREYACQSSEHYTRRELMIYNLGIADGKRMIEDAIKKTEQKPAWSEEDEENFNWFEKFFRAESVLSDGRDIPQERYLWFKSLKYRYTWKPSDEQLEALDSATENCAYSEYQDCLRELMRQLKKLK